MSSFTTSLRSLFRRKLSPEQIAARTIRREKEREERRKLKAVEAEIVKEQFVWGWVEE